MLNSTKLIVPVFLLIPFIFSEQSDPQGMRPNPSEVLDKIRGGIEVGNTRLAVAALAAHIAATTGVSLTEENPSYQGGNAETYTNNRIRHRNPQNAVTKI